DADQPVPREPDGDVLEIVLSGTVDDQLIGGHTEPAYLGERVFVQGFQTRFGGQNARAMPTTARRAATATLVALAIVVAALALWKIRAVIALLFLGFIIAAAMRPGVEWLNRSCRMPRGAGVLLHYLALLGAVALVLWLIVPRAITQVEQAVGNVPTSAQALHTEAKHSTGVKREILLG